MPTLLSTDQTQLDRRVRAALSAGTSAEGQPLFPDLDTPGTPGYNLRRILVTLLQQERRDANSLIREFSFHTATGTGLREWLSLFGMEAGRATKAKGQVKIISEVTGRALEQLFGSRVIPYGTRLVSGSLELLTTEEVEIPATGRDIDVPVEHALPGPGTRAAAGTRLSVEVPSMRSSLTAEVTQSVTGGAGSETDAQLRYRLSMAMTNPSAYDGFLSRLRGHSSVSDAQLEENKYGPGTVEAFVYPAIAFPTSALRYELEALWAGPSKVYVTFPSYEGLALHIRVDQPVSTSGAIDYINNLSVGETAVLSQIENRLLEAGAGDAQVIGIKRGHVSEDARLLDPRRLSQITNVTPLSGKHKWLSKGEWITLCTTEVDE